MFKGKNIVKYYFRKIFRYIPLNVVCMLGVVNFMPYIGYGPIWINFSKLTAGC
jgi:hypothetical protein